MDLSDDEIDSIRAVGSGRAWSVDYYRLERLVEKGYVNSTMNGLTEKGKWKLSQLKGGG